MYAVFDERNRLIAYHDRKRIVDKYIENVYKHNKVALIRKKIRKNESEYLQIHNANLYLVPYGEIYIQCGFIQYIELADNRMMEDTQYAVDILYRVLELCDLNMKKQKSVQKAIGVLEELIDNEATYTPMYDELIRLKEMYDPYIYNYRMLTE